MTDRVDKTDGEWLDQLGRTRFQVLRQAGTEPAFSGQYYDCHDDGSYHCGACGALLFTSDAKFDSGTGWPSFTEPAIADALELVEDRSHGMIRVEVRCKRCGSHLGHVFEDGPQPTGLRYCINSLALDFDKNEEHKPG